MPNATSFVNIWPYGTTHTWIAESHIIAGFGIGYPTRDLIVRTAR